MVISFIIIIIIIITMIMIMMMMMMIIITAVAASESEVNERGSSLISRRLHYRGLQSLFLPNARNCGYAQMGDLGCAVICPRNCGYARMETF